MKNISVKSIIISAICILVIVVGVICITSLDTDFRDSVLLEAGQPLSMELFFEKEVPSDALFVTDTTEISTDEEGSFAVEISFDSKTYTSAVTVRDTTPPAVTVKNGLTKWWGKPISAEECIESIDELSPVKIEWLMEPDDIQGDRKGVVLVTDSNGNSTKADVTVNVIKDITPPVISGVTDVSACLNDDITLLENVVITDNRDPKPSVIVSLKVSDCYVEGEYPVTYRAEDAAGNVTEAHCLVTLTEDKTAPLVVCKSEYNLPVSDGASVVDIASLIVASDNSLSPLTVSVEGNPDQRVEGATPVVFTVSDKTGNTTVVESVVNVGHDLTPPVIGVNPIQIFLGDSVSYRNQTPVTDDFVGKVTLEIDSGNVNLAAVGEYTVTFKATDAAGNVATATAPVSVVERPSVEAETYQMIDELLEEITTPEMTPIEKLWEAYNWINENIRYISTSDKSNYVVGAYDGLVNRAGDCYNYYALVRIVAERLGFEHREVVRDHPTSEHYWNLVNYEGEWYHIDASRFITGNALMFMINDKEAEAWDRTYYRIGHIYDHSLHPEVSSKSLQEYIDYSNKRINLE